MTFNLHFQEPLNLTGLHFPHTLLKRFRFQSPFSGAFESYKPRCNMPSKPRSSHTYLHFQEPLNLTNQEEGFGSMRCGVIFQSPFSGAFESYRCLLHAQTLPSGLSISIFRSLWILLIPMWKPLVVLMCLSISIFRSLWILPLLLPREDVARVELFQSPFSGAFESYWSDSILYLQRRMLSISIFRSLWILRVKSVLTNLWAKKLSISIFRSLWILHPINLRARINARVIFQSPFSGAFESYSRKASSGSWLHPSFQSPFSGAFESYTAITIYNLRTGFGGFQSPFSGAFESYITLWMIWLVSSTNFQSPFSGAFESYESRQQAKLEVCNHLSISIFRSLWILQADFSLTW